MRNGLDYSEHFKTEETLQGDAEGSLSCFAFYQGQIFVLYTSLGVFKDFSFALGFSLIHTVSNGHVAHPNYSLQECQCGGRNLQSAKREQSEGSAQSIVLDLERY